MMEDKMSKFKVGQIWVDWLGRNHLITDVIDEFFAAHWVRWCADGSYNLGRFGDRDIIHLFKDVPSENEVLPSWYADILLAEIRRLKAVRTSYKNSLAAAIVNISAYESDLNKVSDRIAYIENLMGQDND
jgi:hypothetical protein